MGLWLLVQSRLSSLPLTRQIDRSTIGASFLQDSLMTIYRFVVGFNHPDPRSAGYLHDAHALGFDNLQRITCQDLFFIEGQLSLDECRQLTLKLLTDPVTNGRNCLLKTPPRACLPLS
jgi:hypothetical protein